MSTPVDRRHDSIAFKPQKQSDVLTHHVVQRHTNLLLRRRDGSAHFPKQRFSTLETVLVKPPM